MNNTFSIESILFKDMYSNNNNTISNTKITKSLDDCVYDAYKSSEDLKFYETYTMINDYNNTQKLRMLNKLRYATNNIKNKQAHNSCESYIRSLEEDTNVDNGKKKNAIVRFFTMIGTAIKRFFGIVRRAIKRFIDWILRKNKNDDNQQLENNEPKGLPAPESSSNDNVGKNNEDEKQKAERRKMLEEKRGKQIDEMKKLDEISKKNGEYKTMDERSHTNDTNTTYTGKKADVNTLNNFKESIKKFKEKYGSNCLMPLYLLKYDHTYVDDIINDCRMFYKVVEISNGDVEKIKIASEVFTSRIAKFNDMPSTFNSMKSGKESILDAAIRIVFPNVTISSEELKEDDLIKNPKMLDNIADDRVISYFKKLTSDQEKKLKELEKLSDDFVKLCIKMVNDPRVGSSGIMGTKLNEKKASYDETEVNKMETHGYLIYLKQTMKKWNDITSNYNIALSKIYNYFVDVQILRNAVRTYFEKTSGFKK